jgi:hypothetical protein
VASVRTDVSEESIASIVSVERFSELGTKLAVTTSYYLPVTANIFLLR